MKIKRILTIIALCLCSVFCLVGCTTIEGITAEDVSSAINQIKRTNQEMLYDRLTNYYLEDSSCLEVNLSTYEKTFSGIENKTSSQKIIKYTDGRKVKYRNLVYDSNGAIDSNLYEVVDYRESQTGTVLQYDLESKTYKTLANELHLESILFTSPSHLIYVLMEEHLQIIDNVAVNKFENGKEEYIVMSGDSSAIAFDCMKFVFNGKKLESILVDDFRQTVIEKTFITFNYQVEDFFVDVSECVPA